MTKSNSRLRRVRLKPNPKDEAPWHERHARLQSSSKSAAFVMADKKCLHCLLTKVIIDYIDKLPKKEQPENKEILQAFCGMMGDMINSYQVEDRIKAFEYAFDVVSDRVYFEEDESARLH